MFKNFKILLFVLIFFPLKLNALIEVDITRGNLNPLPIAISPLSLDDKSKEEFSKILKKKRYWLRNIKSSRKQFKSIWII